MFVLPPFDSGTLCPLWKSNTVITFGHHTTGHFAWKTLPIFLIHTASLNAAVIFSFLPFGVGLKNGIKSSRTLFCFLGIYTYLRRSPYIVLEPMDQSSLPSYLKSIESLIQSGSNPVLSNASAPPPPAPPAPSVQSGPEGVAQPLVLRQADKSKLHPLSPVYRL